MLVSIPIIVAMFLIIVGPTATFRQFGFENK